MGVVVAGKLLTDAERNQWVREEAAAAEEAQIQRVMAALDIVAEEEIEGEWDNHLRRMAVAAIGAM